MEEYDESRGGGHDAGKRGEEERNISAPLVLSQERMEEVCRRLHSLEEQIKRLQVRGGVMRISIRNSEIAGMTGADKDERQQKPELTAELSVKDFTEDNLSKERAVVYFGQMGPKWHKTETREEKTIYPLLLLPG